MVEIKQTDRQTVVKKSVMITANRLTYKPKNQNYLEIVYQQPMNVSKKIRKISHPELDISLNLSNISKEVSQLAN